VTAFLDQQDIVADGRSAEVVAMQFSIVLLLGGIDATHCKPSKSKSCFCSQWHRGAATSADS
jgi:hypothetical protein